MAERKQMLLPVHLVREFLAAIHSDVIYLSDGAADHGQPFILVQDLAG